LKREILCLSYQCVRKRWVLKHKRGEVKNYA